MIKGPNLQYLCVNNLGIQCYVYPPWQITYRKSCILLTSGLISIGRQKLEHKKPKLNVVVKFKITFFDILTRVHILELNNEWSFTKGFFFFFTSHVSLKLWTKQNVVNVTQHKSVHGYRVNIRYFRKQQRLLMCSINKLTVCRRERSHSRYTSPDIFELALWETTDTPSSSASSSSSSSSTLKTR